MSFLHIFIAVAVGKQRKISGGEKAIQAGITADLVVQRLSQLLERVCVALRISLNRKVRARRRDMPCFKIGKGSGGRWCGSIRNGTRRQLLEGNTCAL